MTKAERKALICKRHTMRKPKYVDEPKRAEELCEDDGFASEREAYRRTMEVDRRAQE